MSRLTCIYSTPSIYVKYTHASEGKAEEALGHRDDYVCPDITYNYIISVFNTRHAIAAVPRKNPGRFLNLKALEKSRRGRSVENGIFQISQHYFMRID